MNRCNLPPELTLAQLSAFLDGDADAAVRAHVQNCPSCRARATLLATAQARLGALMWRDACPAPERLRDYAWDLLAQDEASQIAHHVAYCPHCTAEFFQDFYAGDLSGDDLFTQAARRVGEVEYRIASPIHSDRGSTERISGAAGGSHVYDAGSGVLVSITSLPDETRTERWVLEAALSGLEPDGMQVNLWQEAELIAVAVLDAGGDFRAAGLLPGQYQLAIHGPTTKLWIDSVEVGGR